MTIPTTRNPLGFLTFFKAFLLVRHVVSIVRRSLAKMRTFSICQLMWNKTLQLPVAWKTLATPKPFAVITNSSVIHAAPYKKLMQVFYHFWQLLICFGFFQQLCQIYWNVEFLFCFCHFGNFFWQLWFLLTNIWF